MRGRKHLRNRPRARRDRRGVALVMTLMLTFAMGALAMAAIYLTSSSQLVGKMAEHEKELRYAADAALQVGKSMLNNNPSALPDSGYTQAVSNGTLIAADGSSLKGITYNLYDGPTGSTTGQFGRFASVVAETNGPLGAKFVRRLELEQESFARYAYWTNNEKSSSGATIYFANGDVLWGPVWSNDIISIYSSGATFNDDVGTAKYVSGAGYGTFKKGYKQYQTPITLPTITTLAKLPGYATSGSLNFTSPTTAGASTIRKRLEFVAVDLNGDGDSTDVDEGFVKVYQANAGEDNWLRGDWTTNKTSAENCGDWHHVLVGGVKYWQFFPVAVHGTTSAYAWARNMWIAGGDYNTSAQASNHAGLTVAQIMSTATWGVGQPSPRCYPGGDPHLVAVERNAIGGVAAGQKGGVDSTFTANGSNGAWQQWLGAVDPRLAAIRPWDASYLFPLYRGQNPGYKGVIYVSGSAGVSGVLRGRVTLYMKNTAVLLDDQRYATDPANGVCNDMLGLISGDDIVVADNSINTPQNVGAYRNFDDTKDMYIHGVMMALSESFTVENYSSGPNNANDCETINVGRGCLYMTGGLIQERRGAVGLTSGEGFIKRYSYDRCAVQIPPPYFPTTGRFLDNRYSEIDPGRFNVATLFSSLTPGP